MVEDPKATKQKHISLFLDRHDLDIIDPELENPWHVLWQRSQEDRFVLAAQLAISALPEKPDTEKLRRDITHMDTVAAINLGAHAFSMEARDESRHFVALNFREAAEASLNRGRVLQNIVEAAHSFAASARSITSTSEFQEAHDFMEFKLRRIVQVTKTKLPDSETAIGIVEGALGSIHADVEQMLQTVLPKSPARPSLKPPEGGSEPEPTP